MMRKASWYEAVAYCRWLTAQAQLGEADQCYADPQTLAKNEQGNPKDWPFQFDRSGFRLLTEAEWEYVCRSGMKTSYSFGNDRQLLSRYGWFQQNSNQWSHMVGRLRPDLRGVFDTHGNLLEWCHDWAGGVYDGAAQDPYGPDTGSNRVCRGERFSYAALIGRSAFRHRSEPAGRSRISSTRVSVRYVKIPPKFGNRRYSDAE